MIMKNEALRTEIIKFWTAYKPLIVQKEKTKTTLPIPSQNKKDKLSVLPKNILLKEGAVLLEKQS